MNPLISIRRIIFLVFSLFMVGCVFTPNPTSNEVLPITQTNTPSQQQRLRIINQSSVSLINLVVIFPEDRIEFGDVPAGGVTDYYTVPNGVYRYAAYNVAINGMKYEQPVIDWVGETPIQGNDFTYTLDVDTNQWTTRGQVILLVKLNEDP